MDSVHDDPEGIGFPTCDSKYPPIGRPWPKEGGGNGFQTIEAGMIICNAASPIPPAGYDDLRSCRLHLPYDHWHRILIIDGKTVIEWNKEY